MSEAARSRRKRLLVAMPHYFNAEGSGRHGSTRKDPAPRLRALRQAVLALHQVLGRRQAVMNIKDRRTEPANAAAAAGDIEIRICTTRGCHLLDDLGLPAGLVTHVETEAEPMMLGFECHRVLAEGLGRFDMFAFMEDDLVVHDPMMLDKIAWFAATTDQNSVLQPNRFERAPRPPFKLYVDGDIRPGATAAFQTPGDGPRVATRLFGRDIAFERPLNPHAGCFFLTADQMAAWRQADHFLDRDTGFIGPLESAAGLGVFKTFKIYKPAPAHAGFLEIEHFGTAFQGLIGRGIRHDDESG